MKKAVIFLLVLTLLFSFCGCENGEGANETPTPTQTVEVTPTIEPTPENDETLAETLIREIDSAYLQDQAKPEYGTTAGMIELSDIYCAKWKQVADEYYNKIMEYDDIESAEQLHNSVSNLKANWEEYYNEQCNEYRDTLVALYGNGTVIGVIFADYKYEMHKEWALELVGIYMQMYVE